MQDVKLNNLELFYDCVDESNNFLYEVFRKPYFELIEMTVKNILAGEVLTEFEDPNDLKKLKKIYAKIKNVDFTVEDVRKAMQSIILRGFKEMRIPNGNTTPDTIGIFMAYLITKMCPNKEISIVDPLCGTGNLLFTIANYLDKETKLYACDNDLWMTKLTSLTSDLLGLNTEVFLQDSLELNLSGIDSLVFDMPHEELKDNKYFPYEAILHYKNMLKDDGCMIGMVENDFFNYDKNQEFKKKLLEDMSIIGLTELPDEMFKAVKPKIILVLQKRKLSENTKCFMVKLPSFTNVNSFNEALLDIEAWFEKNNKK
jgi:site-specific DNA-methyltransferase (adenine-specific)